MKLLFRSFFEYFSARGLFCLRWINLWRASRLALVISFLESNESTSRHLPLSYRLCCRMMDLKVVILRHLAGVLVATLLIPGENPVDFESNLIGDVHTWLTLSKIRKWQVLSPLSPLFFNKSVQPAFIPGAQLTSFGFSTDLMGIGQIRI